MDLNYRIRVGSAVRTPATGEVMDDTTVLRVTNKAEPPERMAPPTLVSADAHRLRLSWVEPMTATEITRPLLFLPC